MATGRVLVIHESAATRALLAELLAQEGLRAEAVESTFAAMVRFVDEPAALVILGLSGLGERELELIPALKKEAAPPRILVSFAGPQRDLAVRALALGADGYLLEPFYNEELLGVVRGMLQPAPTPADSLAALAGLAREVAHAVNNPLQVLALLLGKEKVTKRELMKGVPEQTARIEAVVRHLREFAGVPEARPAPQEAYAVAAASEFAVETEAGLPAARIDAKVYAAALGALHDALRARTGGPLAAQLAAEPGAVVLRCTVARDAFAGEDVSRLPGEIFVVSAGREVLPGLARARRLLESMQGALEIEQHGDRLVFLARVPTA